MQRRRQGRVWLGLAALGRAQEREAQEQKRRQQMPHAGVWTLPQPCKVRSRGAASSTANRTAESRAEGTLGYQWLQGGIPLAGYRHGQGAPDPKGNSEPRYQVWLGSQVEGRGAELGGFVPLPCSQRQGHGGGTRCSTASPELPLGGGSCSFSSSRGLLLPLEGAQTGTQRSGNWLPSNLAPQH